jgi:hypothetical protein
MSPLWLAGEAVTRAMFDLCKADWPAIHRYALDHGTQSTCTGWCAARSGPEHRGEFVSYL